MNSVSRIFISAGEQSGDMHGAALMRELKKLAEINFFGLGGDMMANEGLDPLAHIKDLAATGIKEVAKKYFYFKSVLKQSAGKISEQKPLAVILIDFPGLNLRLAKKIRKFYDGKIIYYISPQVWAWHENRVKLIKECIDKMLVVFPFEVEYYKNHGIIAEYTGHPLVKRISDFLANKTKKPELNQHKIITLLPGSRNDEVIHHLPVLLDTVEMLRSDFKIKLYISRAKNIKNGIFESLLKNKKDFEIIENNIYDCIFSSNLVMAKAGTSTMECSLIGTPFLIFYKTYNINYYTIKPFVKISNTGIINILSGEKIVKEFIQNDFNKFKLYDESFKILSDKAYSEQIINNLKKVWGILGNSNSALNAALAINNIALK